MDTYYDGFLLLYSNFRIKNKKNPFLSLRLNFDVKYKHKFFFLCYTIFLCDDDDLKIQKFITQLIVLTQTFIRIPFQL